MPKRSKNLKSRFKQQEKDNSTLREKNDHKERNENGRDKHTDHDLDKFKQDLKDRSRKFDDRSERDNNGRDKHDFGNKDRGKHNNDKGDKGHDNIDLKESDPGTARNNIYIVSKNNKLEDINDAGGSRDILASRSRFSDAENLRGIDSNGDGFVDQLSMDMLGRSVTIQNFFDNSGKTVDSSGFGKGLIEQFVFQDGRLSAKDIVSKIDVANDDTSDDDTSDDTTGSSDDTSDDDTSDDTTGSNDDTSDDDTSDDTTGSNNDTSDDNSGIDVPPVDGVSGTELGDTLAGGSEQDTLMGLAGDDILMGYADADNIDGGSGNDYIDGGSGIDTMMGREGDDVYVVDNVNDNVVELAGEGFDTILTNQSLNMADNIEKIRLQGSNDLSATGNDLDNQMFGNNGNNTLNGGLGNDVIDGGAGADVMLGGVGDDFYYIDNEGDTVTELESEGTDTVYSTLNHTLGDNFENLRLFGTDALNGNGNALNNTITGNSASNTLVGFDGEDVIDGGAGVDTLIGGNHNDWYIIRNTNDVIIEEAGDLAGATDYAFAYVDYTIADNVENLRLYGNSNLDGTGNSGDNVLYGNYGTNVLRGLEGNDFIDGGAGGDTMYGGLGDDNYVIDSVNDVVIELDNEGFDTILARANVTMADNIEKLRMQGNDNLRAIGNDADNIMIGNNGNNSITGGAGNDNLLGLGGNDTFIFGLGSGHDAIGDFENGNDLLDISGWNITDFNDLIITEKFGDTSITFDGAGSEMITLQNVDSADLDASDFILA